MTFNKLDLEKAFNQGKLHADNPSKKCSFNRWFNETYLDGNRCSGCVFSNKVFSKSCKTCEEFINFEKN